MAKIEHIVGEGPELAESQRRVLEVMEKHPDHLFRMQTDDLAELQAWVDKPDAPEPPRIYRELFTLGTIRWAMSTLHNRRKIGSVVLHRRTYYGSFEAIERAREAEEKARPINSKVDL